MDELVRWLNGQLDEDERIAREATQGAWVWSREFVTPPGYHHRTVGPLEPGDAAYIAEHSPAQVLAEIDAKRRILSDVLPTMRADEIRIAGEWGIGSEQVREASDDLLSLLALPYADRPGYRDEWRP
jgi:hypothetical protein